MNVIHFVKLRILHVHLLVASFWPGVPWLIFGLECLGYLFFWWSGVPLVCFLGLECLWLIFGLESLALFGPGVPLVMQSSTGSLSAHGSSLWQTKSSLLAAAM